MFNSAAVDVTPSNMLSSDAVAVTPSSILSSAAVDVIAVPLKFIASA